MKQGLLRWIPVFLLAATAAPLLGLFSPEGLLSGLAVATLAALVGVCTSPAHGETARAWRRASNAALAAAAVAFLASRAAHGGTEEASYRPSQLARSLLQFALIYAPVLGLARVGLGLLDRVRGRSEREPRTQWRGRLLATLKLLAAILVVIGLVHAELYVKGWRAAERTLAPYQREIRPYRLSPVAGFWTAPDERYERVAPYAYWRATVCPADEAFCCFPGHVLFSARGELLATEPADLLARLEQSHRRRLDNETEAPGRVRHGLQVLAAGPEAQRSLFPEGKPLGRQLLREFYIWYPTLRGSELGSGLPGEALARLAEVERHVVALEDAPDPALMSAGSVAASAAWSVVRDRAAAALDALGWPRDLPPSVPADPRRGP